MCKELVPDPNLKNILMDIEDYMLAHQGVDAFDEIIKLLISKLYDEKVNLEIFPEKDYKYPQKIVGFQIHDDEKETFDCINKLFEKSKAKWKGIFPHDDVFNINPHIMYYSVKNYRTYSLTSTELDSLGEAFEALINPRIKGEKGQFFTPHQVVKMAVSMINPKITDKILDPACGSGSFLIESINKIIHENNINESQIVETREK